MTTKNWPIDSTGRLKWLALATGGLALCFAWPLFDLVRFSIGRDLYSHIVLIPFISLYLVWLKRAMLSDNSTPDRPVAVLLLGCGGAILVGFGAKLVLGPPLFEEDSLAFTALAFVFLFNGICALFLGRKALRAFAFPLGFLVFTVPLPTFLMIWTESFLQQGSASVAWALLKLYGTPVFRDDLVFQLPGISLQIAPECSGIHSTLALFITGLLAGYFFLRSAVSRSILALAVIPLALARNGFRVFVIGELCVHISPDMINSYIHRHGGPIFFALSLIPFFILLFVLVKLEGRGQSPSVRA